MTEVRVQNEGPGWLSTFGQTEATKVLRISSSIRFFGQAAVMAAVLAGASGLTQAQELKVPAPHRHAPISIRRVHDDGSYDSTNWAGYAVTGNNGSVTSVTGSWIVPTATCGSGRGSSAEYASFWVGIDGWTSNSVEQIGTDSDCSNGKPSYYAWYEFYPEPSYYAGKLTNLTPGHKMSATVSYNAAKADFTATITDETEPSLTFTTTFTPTRQTGTPQRSSAEWIAEAPSSSSGVLALADFGTVYFGDDYTSVAGTCYATVSNVTGSINSFGSNVQMTSMVTEGKNPLAMATPSALTKDGSSFLVTWYSVGP
jgi:hypothetical protein